MDADRFRRIQELFFQALERPAEARAAFLDGACDDAEIRREVNGMLTADAGDDAFFLDEPLITVGDSPRLGDEVEVAGREVGPYRLLRLLGRGGMGAVYLAERDDLDREVALKIIRGDLADPDARRRFLFERRVLARLDHPGIARLYDAGVAEDGTPYFAMERVEGVPITDYCDRERLGLDARIRLFERVGRAVQHAHQHFIVHRDLKPSNILVTDETGEPSVKLLDFGIAKALDDAEGDDTHTRTGRHLMTPAYAAPEQAAGEPVTAAMDVYSLGVVLFELLTGRRPYDDVATTEPSRPSTAVTEAGTADTAQARSTTTDRLARRLRGDLDTICLKALHPDPERRYASAEAFVDDIRRHLDGLPVTARRDSVGYRARAFVRRHRTGVAASVAALAVLFTVVGLYTVRLRAERAMAERETDKAETVTSFLLDLLAAAEPATAPTDTLTVRTLLARGLREIDALDGQPAVQAEMLGVVGTVYARLGQYDRAVDLLERSLSLRRTEFGDRSLEVADALGDLGLVQIEQGTYGIAEANLRESLARRHDLLPSNDPSIAESLNNLALALVAAGRLDEAEPLYLDAVRILETQTEATPGRAEVYNNLGTLYQEQGRYDEAEPLHRKALAIWRATLGETHAQVTLALNELGLVRSRMGDLEESKALYEETIRRWRVLYGDDHPAIGLSLSNLGVVLDKMGDYDEAELLKTEVLERHRRFLGPNHPEVGLALGNLAVTVANRGDYARAAALHREELAIKRAALGDDHPDVALTYHNLGYVLTQQGRYTEAVASYQRAIDTWLKSLAPDHPDLGGSRFRLSEPLVALGRYDEAERELRMALRIRRDALGADHPRTAQVMSGLGEVLTKEGAFEEAERYLLQAQTILADRSDDNPDRIRTRERLAALQAATRGR